MIRKGNYVNYLATHRPASFNTDVEEDLFITGLGWMFDAMDQGMVSGVMAAIGKEWALSTGQLGLLGSAGMLGMALGAALSGMTADRLGRRAVIMWTLVIFGLGSGLSGFSANYPMLLVLRFITGFGLGEHLRLLPISANFHHSKAVFCWRVSGHGGG